MSSLPTSPHPPVHRHSHHHASPQNRSSSRPHHTNQRRVSAPLRHQQSPPSTAAASPEVISSLVDQLSKLSPSPLHNPNLYGSLAPQDDSSFPSANGLVRDIDYEYSGRDGFFLHPDDAAMPPVVRTSKPPSGFSPVTNGESEHNSRRNSGISVGKGGVDIPSYVRTYMNRAAGLEADSHRSSSSRISSDSGKSSRKDGGRGRLSYVSSRERIREDKSTSRDREKGREREREEWEDSPLQPPPGGILSSPGRDDPVRAIPDRRSSWGKGSSNTSYSAVVTTDPPLHMSPLGSPRFPPAEYAIQEDESEDDAAPPPQLHRSRTEQKKEKRNSKSFPARSDSLPVSPGGVRTKQQRQKSNPASPRSPRKQKQNRNSEPQGLFVPNYPNSPPRPSFQSLPETRRQHQEPEPSIKRPSSADSIDDAVDAYLCSPRLSQKIRMPGTSRVISFSEVGDPQGFAVFVCVGMGLTRYVTAFYDELALTLGLRLITPDRPGVGESEPIDEAERTVLNWPDDVLYICQSLKITKFSVLAHSAGAIYALATALRMPGHIRGKIHLLAPWIPPSQMDAVSTAPGETGGKVASVPTSQRILRALPTPILKAANSSFMSATSSSLTTSLPRTAASRKTPKRRANTPIPHLKDPANGSSSQDGDSADTENMPPFAPLSAEDELLVAAALSLAEKERQSSYDERLTSAIWTLSTRNANPAVDLLTCLERTRPVGFRYVDITRAVVIWHGVKDTRVPVANVEWLGRSMRRCEVRILTHEGHGLMASAKVMGEVLEEIAAEWRDWKKVVEGREKEGGPGGRERLWAD